MMAAGCRIVLDIRFATGRGISAGIVAKYLAAQYVGTGVQGPVSVAVAVLKVVVKHGPATTPTETAMVVVDSGNRVAVNVVTHALPGAVAAAGVVGALPIAAVEALRWTFVAPKRGTTEFGVAVGARLACAIAALRG